MQFPGDFGGFGSDPAAFAEKLDSVLRRNGSTIAGRLAVADAWLAFVFDLKADGREWRCVARRAILRITRLAGTTHAPREHDTRRGVMTCRFDTIGDVPIAVEN